MFCYIPARWREPARIVNVYFILMRKYTGFVVAPDFLYSKAGAFSRQGFRSMIVYSARL